VLSHRTRLVLALATVAAVTALVFGGAAAYAAAAGDGNGDGRRAGEAAPPTPVCCGAAPSLATRTW